MSEATPVSNLSAKKFGSIWAPERFTTDYGLGLAKMRDDAEFDFRHVASTARIELKACRGSSGVFTFQYIRPDCFDVCVCLHWEDGRYGYWILPTNDLRPHLSRQHRSANSFQLRIGPRRVPTFSRYEATPTMLRAKLDAIAFPLVKSRSPVRLDPVLAGIEGWSLVSSSIATQLDKSRLAHWSFVLKPFPGPRALYDPEALPYPTFNEEEMRIEFWVHPEPIFGRSEVAATAESLFLFLVAYLCPDDFDYGSWDPGDEV